MLIQCWYASVILLQLKHQPIGLQHEVMFPKRFTSCGQILVLEITDKSHVQGFYQ